MKTETIIGSVTALTGIVALYYLMRGNGATVVTVPALNNNSGDTVVSPTVTNPIPAYAASNFAPNHDYTKSQQSRPVSQSDCGCGNYDPCAKPKNVQPVYSTIMNLLTTGSQAAPNNFPAIPTYQPAPQLPPSVPSQSQGRPAWMLPHVEGYA